MSFQKCFLALICCLPLLAEATSPTSPQTGKAQTVSQQAAPSHYPKRGMSMAQVRKHFGQPQSTRESRGKTRKNWPRITVWNYGKFSVYFERTRVLHTVVH